VKDVCTYVSGLHTHLLQLWTPTGGLEMEELSSGVVGAQLKTCHTIIFGLLPCESPVCVITLGDR